MTAARESLAASNDAMRSHLVLTHDPTRLLATAIAVAAVAITGAACGGAGGASPAASATAAGSGSSSGGDASRINGAGATFPEPIYVKWAGDYRTTSGVSINYQGVGSGAGIEQFTRKTTDFGASDAPMKDDEIQAAEAAGGPVLHVPTVLGAVVPVYHLKGVPELRLDGPTLAGIFLGTIETWNDPKIAALNPGAKLPDTGITVVHRSDSSGTSYVFTGYLSAVSPDWKDKVGQDKAPEWPTGTGATKNDGVAAQVQQTDGAVGYAELSYAIKNDIAVAQLRNRSGAFVRASLASTTAAGEGQRYPEDLRFSLLDSPNPQAWPIVTATWQLLWQDPGRAGLGAAKAEALRRFVRWELTDGQREAGTLGYAPLPAALQKLALAKVDSIRAS